MTDGVSMCIRYGTLKIVRDNDGKPKEQESLKDFAARTNAELASDDPGRVNPFYFSRRSGNGFRHMRLSRAMYKKINLSERFQAERTKRKEDAIVVVNAEKLLAEAGGWKSRMLEGYMKSLKVFAEHGEAIMTHYGHKDYTKFKMMSFRRKNTVITQRFAHFFDVDRPTASKPYNRQKHPASRGIIMGVGNASFAPNGKGETSVPTKGIVKLLIKYFKSRGIEFRIVSINEYKTTKCCHMCGNDLDNILDSITSRVIRGLKSCCHCGTETDPVLLNRDANAAINILLCLEAKVYGLEWPTHLRRPSSAENMQRSSHQ